MRWQELDDDTDPRIRSRTFREALIDAADTAQSHGKDFVTSHRWQDAFVVLAYSVLTGLVIVGFTLLAEGGTYLFRKICQIDSLSRFLPLVWTPLLTVIIVWITRKYAPAAVGSGIPQVVKYLDANEDDRKVNHLVSLKLAIKKVLLVGSGFLAGLSLGREGPAVQVGAGVMSGAEKHLSSLTKIKRHDLVVAGAAAGIAASFNTPLGGIAFALEQLVKYRSFSQSNITIASIVLSGLVSISYFGDVTYFGILKVQEISSKILIPGIFVVIASGILGGLFSKILVASLKGTINKRCCAYRVEHPLKFAAICGFLVAVMGILSLGSVTGAGYWATKGLLDGTDDVPSYYTALKFIATWLTTWAGVPAGVFAPSLAIGAGIGRDVATLAQISTVEAIPLIALGMVGFLAASTQGPITAFVIVMEMIAGHTMVLSLMIAALFSSAISRMIARPMYSELAELFGDSVQKSTKS